MPRNSGVLTQLGPEPSTEETAATGLRRFKLGLGSALFGAYAFFLLLVVSALWTLTTHDREHELVLQQAEVSSLARVFEEHATNTLFNMELLLDASAREFGIYQHELALHPDSAIDELRQRIATRLSKVAAASAIRLADPQGQTLIALRDAGMPANITPPPSQPDQWTSNPSAPMRIGHPLALGTQESSRWQLPVERAATQQGKLIGTLSALIDLHRFAGFYAEVNLRPEDRVLLLTDEGTLLLRHPFSAGDIGSDLSGSPVFTHSKGERAVVFSGRMRVDEPNSIVAVRRLAHYPALVVVSRPYDIALRDFSEMRRRLVFGAGLLLTLLLALITLAYRDIRRREADRAELRRINASLEARVGRRTAELEQTNRELLAFSYSVSHDLRTPLRAINGFAHALREDYEDRLDGAGRDFLDRIYRASLRMGELIDELLSLANLSRQPLSFGDIDFSTLVSDVAEDLKLADPHRSVRIDIQSGMRIDGDEVLLRNALTNLLGNAWKFTRSRNPSFIAVSARDEGDRVRYTVSDNGVGFDMAHAKRLFQPFQQLHGDQGYGGTGIGLASVRRIIERHGGRIWAEAVPEHGARFIFELPKRMAVLRRRRS